MSLGLSRIVWRMRGWWSAYRSMLIIALATLFIIMTLFTTSQMASTLREKEIHEMELWVRTMEKLSRDVTVPGEPMALDMINARQNIPFVVIDDRMNVISSHLVDEDVLNHPDKLRRKVNEFSSQNNPVVFVQMWSNRRFLLFYGSSELLQRLYYVPITQFFVTFIFFLLAMLVFRSAKQGEQDRVWVGLAKETAHQLGTPISSLMGWIEYLRDSEEVDQSTVDEMSRDLKQLMKVTDRFSKIGADTPLSPASVNEVVDGVVDYFRGRIPRAVSISYDGLSQAPSRAMINTILLEWVLENLLKNSLDALAGSGKITVSIRTTESDVMIEVKDTGRGIPKSAWRKIFDPGYSTKTRGWGLGLSLSRRIVEEYHHGEIGVVESYIGEGTTMRIKLNRLFD